MPTRSTLVLRARELARLAHAGQVRKAGKVPYFDHLEAVSRILEEHGYVDELTHAAAFLHDLVEDQPEHVERMRAEMPPEVIATVAALSEVKTDARGHKLDKRERFAGYVRGLRNQGDAVRRAIPISCADKIHNTLSIVETERAGDGLLLRLSTRPGEHAPQLETLRAVYAPVVRASMLEAFDAARDALLETIEAWLPGRAVHIAAEAHLSQRDKGGAPYIEHPLRLMLRAHGRDAKLVAVLHDVVEDSVSGAVLKDPSRATSSRSLPKARFARESVPSNGKLSSWTLERLRREGFAEHVVRAIDALTKREGERYEDFIERVAADRLATEVKLLDLADNSDLTRIPAPTDADRARLVRYQAAIERLERARQERLLWVVLDEESCAKVQAHASLPVVRGHHVTLAHSIVPSEFDPSLVPGGAAVGDVVDVRAVGLCDDGSLQAFVAEIAGTTARPFDGGILHITVSRVEGARSKDANALVATSPRQPVDLPLRGVVQWVER